MLSALRANATGHLHSIELEPAVRVGKDVPLVLVFRDSFSTAELNHFWTLHLGDSRQVLPKLLNETLGARAVDIFVHGSDHGYEVQSEELWIAKEGGLVRHDGVFVIDRPDYNNYRTLSLFPEDEYERWILPERSLRSPLKFGVVHRR